MANVLFKRGTQAKLNELTSYVEGSFYLTNDTDRLYFAQSASELVPLNQFIRQVEALPAYSSDISVGDMFYLPASNILAVVSAKDDDEQKLSFTQLNPDTYLSANAQNMAVEAATNGAKVSNEVYDSKNHVSSGSFEIVGGGIATVSVEDGKVKVSVPEQPVYSLSAKDVVTGEGDEAVTEHIISLNSKTGSAEAVSAGDIKLKAGTNIGIEVANGEITIKNNLSIAGGFNTGASLGFNEDGALVMGVSDGADTVTANVTPSVSYGHVDGEDGVSHNASAKFDATGKLVLDVYTAEEVDDKIEDALAAADAMTFKGVVSADNAAEKLVITANVGDTYKVGSNITSPVSAKTGDLVIAEGEDGNVTWVVIPSGNDQVISGSTANGIASISDQTGVLAGVKLVDGDVITATYSVENNVVALKASHNKINAEGTAPSATAGDAISQSAHNNETFTIVSDVNVDAYGHVSGFTTHEVTVKDTHNDVQSVAATASVESNTATINVGVSTVDGTTEYGAVNMNSSSLSFAKVADANTISVDIEWGSF